MDSKVDSKQSKLTNTTLIGIKCNDGKNPFVPYFLIKKFKLLTTILKECKEQCIELDKPSDFISRNLYKISKSSIKMDDDELKYLGYEDNSLLNDELIYMFKTILYATRLYDVQHDNLSTETEDNMITYTNDIPYRDDIEKVSVNEFRTNPKIYNYHKVRGYGYDVAYNNFKSDIESNDIYMDMEKLFEKVCYNYIAKFYNYLKSIYKKFEFRAYYSYYMNTGSKLNVDYKGSVDWLDEFYKNNGVTIDSNEKRNFYYDNYKMFAVLVDVRKRFPHLLSSIYKRHILYNKPLSKFFDMENFSFEVCALKVSNYEFIEGVIMKNKTIDLSLKCDIKSDDMLKL